MSETDEQRRTRSTTSPSRRRSAPGAPARARRPGPATLERLHDVPVELAVEIGRTRMTIGETLALGPGSIVTLNRLAGEPVDLLVNGKPIARGEVVVIDEEFGLRVTEVVSDAGRPGAAARRVAPQAPVRVMRALGARMTARGRQLLAQGLRGQRHRAWRRWSPTTCCCRCSRSRSSRCSSPARSCRPRTSRRRWSTTCSSCSRPRRESTLLDGLRRVRESSTTVGIVALVAVAVVRALVLGRAGHGVLPHLPPRRAARGCARRCSRSGCSSSCCCSSSPRVAVPTLQGLVVTAPTTCRSGSSEVRGLVYAVSLAGGLMLLFAILCLIYWRVPRGPIPWRCVWPGALGATLAMARRRLRLPALPLQRDVAAGRHVVRVRPDRAGLVLRARAHPAGRRGGQRAAVRSTERRALKPAACAADSQGDPHPGSLLGECRSAALLRACAAALLGGLLAACPRRSPPTASRRRWTSAATPPSAAAAGRRGRRRARAHDRRPRRRHRRHLRPHLGPAAGQVEPRGDAPRAPAWRPLATLPLGPNRSLHLVRAGDEVVLVGAGEHGVTPIRTYTQAEARALGLLDGADAGRRRMDAFAPAGSARRAAAAASTSCAAGR